MEGFSPIFVRSHAASGYKVSATFDFISNDTNIATVQDSDVLATEFG
jgi:hypothetical protein